MEKKQRSYKSKPVTASYQDRGHQENDMEPKGSNNKPAGSNPMKMARGHNRKTQCQHSLARVQQDFKESIIRAEGVSSDNVQENITKHGRIKTCMEALLNHNRGKKGEADAEKQRKPGYRGGHQGAQKITR